MDFKVMATLNGRCRVRPETLDADRLLVLGKVIGDHLQVKTGHDRFLRLPLQEKFKGSLDQLLRLDLSAGKLPVVAFIQGHGVARG